MADDLDVTAPEPAASTIIRDPDGQMWIYGDGGRPTVHVRPSSSWIVEGSWIRQVRWDQHAGHWAIVDD